MYPTSNLKNIFRGSFRMVREDGTTFDCRIPSFTLKILNEDGPPLENDETPIMDK